MENLFDYLGRTASVSFAEQSFNDVDALALARLSYAPFDGIVGEGFQNQTSLEDACARLLADPAVEQKLLLEQDRRFLSLLQSSRRFGKLWISGYQKQTDETTDKQFAALCIQLLDGCYYLSFRGTDDTLSGWKENFDMSFLMAVPAQLAAAEYVAQASRNLSGSLWLGGHSKGGNLAVYGAAFCPPQVQTSIGKVWNFDGPGFRKSVVEQQGYQSVVDRVETFVPQSSVVGMLLEHEEDYTIVRSSQKGLLQHDPYTWGIKENRFVTLKTTTQTSKLVDETIKDWLAQLSCAQREEFIEALFTVIDQTGAKTVKELSTNWYRTAGSVLRSLTRLDGNMRKAVLYTLWALLKAVGENLLEELVSQED